MSFSANYLHGWQNRALLAYMDTLIVEDDAFFRGVLSSAVRKSRIECTVHETATGKEALELLSRPEIELGVVLVDLTLPDMNGLEVIRRVHANYPSVRILVVSASADEERLLSALREGAIGYVVKGDAHITIDRAIDQLIDGLYPISPQLASYLVKRVSTAGGPDESNAGPMEAGVLTTRERELLEQFACGHTYAKAAEIMGISVATAQTHARNLYRKLGVHSGLQALSKARAQGLV